jgi:RNA polymerase sigma factor (sigma-70 family)
MRTEYRPAHRAHPASDAGKQKDATVPADAPREAAADFPSAEDLLLSHPPLTDERIWKDHAELFEAENLALVKHAAVLMFGYKLPGHLAEDLVQEAWVDLVARWDAVDRPLPWMYAVVKKKAHRLASTMTRQCEAETAATYVGRATPPPNASMETIIALHDTLREVAALPEQQRRAVFLRFFEDRPYDEVADLMQIDKNTVGPHIHRARSKLRARLGDLGLAVLFLATLAGVPTTRAVNPATGQGEALTGPHDFYTAATADCTALAGGEDEDTAAALRAKAQQYLEWEQQYTSETAMPALEDSPDSYVDAALSSMSDEERAAALETLREALAAYTPEETEEEYGYAEYGYAYCEYGYAA